MAALSLKIPDALDARLRAAAAKRGKSKSLIARAAIEAFVEKEDRGLPGSCLDLAWDLKGRIEGLGDLSFNKKRMQGFGK